MSYIVIFNDYTALFNSCISSLLISKPINEYQKCTPFYKGCFSRMNWPLEVYGNNSVLVSGSLMDPQAIHKSKYWTKLHITSKHQLNM